MNQIPYHIFEWAKEQADDPCVKSIIIEPRRIEITYYPDHKRNDPPRVNIVTKPYDFDYWPRHFDHTGDPVPPNSYTVSNDDPCPTATRMDEEVEIAY